MLLRLDAADDFVLGGSAAEAGQCVASCRSGGAALVKVDYRDEEGGDSHNCTHPVPSPRAQMTITDGVCNQSHCRIMSASESSEAVGG